jgi:ribonucleoside-diphosphate reductase alpha subunit
MKVIKRDGSREEVQFDKITNRIRHLCAGTDSQGVQYGVPLTTLDPIRLSMKVIEYIKDNITTRELDEYTAESAVAMAFENPEYGELAGRILISNHHKNTTESFSITMKRLYEYKDERGHSSPLINRDLYKLVEKYGKRIDAEIDYLRDYKFDYSAFKTLERSYLIKYQSGTYIVQERPQHMWMRVALGILGPCTTAMISNGNNKLDINEMFVRAFETYYLLSNLYYIQATPTLYNAGTPRPQLSSCFLLGVEDSLKGIYKALSDCAEISKWAGGIGLCISDIRPAGSYIRGTNGRSNGILPMLKVFSDTAKYVDQCFTPDTLLYTPNGPVAIGQLSKGDSVITHTGHIQKIERVLCHKVSSEVYRINIKDSKEPIVVTLEHQVLVLRKQPDCLNYDEIRGRLENGYAKLEWSDVKDLKVDDFVCFPKPDDNIIVDIPALSIDDLRFYGILVGSSHNDSGILLPLTDFCKNYLERNGVCPTVTEGNNIQLEWNSISHVLYDANNEKIIDKRFFMLPKEKCQAIVQGIFEAGHEVSKSVSESIRFLLWRCARDNLTHNNMSMLQVTAISTEKYDGNLYDLEVENDHTYITANLGIVHNGGGKRMGSFAVYIEPWHPEILDFLQAKMPTGHEEMRARHLFYALWIPDLFMRRVNAAVEEEQASTAEKRTRKVILWSTFCPHECPNLSNVWGPAFDTLYEKYESEGKAREQIDIMKIWRQILTTQKETGIPYLLYKDACNAKSNQQNVGTIKISNLCTEIIEYSDSKEYATCNLASISLPKHLKVSVTGSGSVAAAADSETKYEVDHEALLKTAYIITKNLNRVIDINFYPVPETKISNERHRPIGIGVQGLADLLHIMKTPFDSPEAMTINRDIFETIYYGACKASNDLAMVDGPYETFKGSPASKGLLQFDLWNYKPISGRYDWPALKALIVKNGLRNSLMIAPMPTASTSQILGNTECFEPVSDNIFVKRVLAGEFTIVNKHLQRDLIRLGLWTESVRQRIMRTRGSLQDEKLFSDIPANIRNQYKTASELKQRVLIDMAAARGVFIDQSQSLNLFVRAPNDSVLTSMHLYAWKQGLKTGMYYLRRDTVSKAQQFTVAPRNFSEKSNETATVTVATAAATATSVAATVIPPIQEENIPMCRRDNPDCEACGS